MKRLFATTALAAICAAPALAWDGNEAPAKGTILPGWIKKDGTRVAALHLAMAPGWKTYWRAPGDAGIPPVFDWSASRNLASVSISWPAPEVLDQNGMRSIGYTGDLVIPLHITAADPGAPVALKVDMDLGVCSDVCVPYHLEFSAVLDDTGTRPTPAIAAALAERPYTAKEAGVTAATCRVSPTDDGLRVEARVSMPSAGGTEVAVLEPGVADVWVSETKAERRGSEIVAVSEMIHTSSGAFALDRSAIRITILGSRHAVDIQGCAAG